MIFVNFKTYPEGSGEHAVELAKICEQVSTATKIPIIPVVQTVDLFRVSQAVKIPVWIQHVDIFPPGKYTGFSSLDSVVESGATGTLLNHNEHKLPPGTIKQIILKAKKIKPVFKTLVCCSSLGQAEKLLKFKPDYLAYEPPELIGGDVSVTTAEPKAIEHFVALCGKDTIPVIGAGVKSGEDVKIGRKLGIQGFLISHGIVLDSDPKQQLTEIAKAIL